MAPALLIALSLLASTATGLWRSIDDGSTWAHLGGLPDGATSGPTRLLGASGETVVVSIDEGPGKATYVGR